MSYSVCGLPKDPASWQNAGEADALPIHADNAVPRWLRAEILQSMQAGDKPDSWATDLHATSAPRKRPTARKTGKVAPAEPQLPAEIVARIQSKALKLAFPSDIEITASTLAPTSTCHYFSFELSPQTGANVTQPSGASDAFDMAVQATSSTSLSAASSLTFHAASLTVWVPADKHRSQAIRQILEGGGKVSLSHERES